MARKAPLSRIVVVALLLAWAVIGEASKAATETEEYRRWIDAHVTRRGFETGGTGKPEKLVILAVEGDDAEPSPEPYLDSREVTFGTEVTWDGHVSTTYQSSRGTKGGGGGPPLSAATMARLDELLVTLPEDGGRLPPKGRRLLLQGMIGERKITRVYDRASAPESVWEVLRLTESLIGAYAPEFTPSSKINARRFAHDGFLCLSPDGQQLLFTGMNEPLQFWDPTVHELLREVPGLSSTAIVFSPDGTLAVIEGSMDCEVIDTTTWKIVRKLPMATHPQFMPDGRYLLVTTRDAGLAVYETATGKRVDSLSQLPQDAVRYLPAPKGSRAVVQDRNGNVLLWDSVRLRVVARLREKQRLLQVAFSPDETQVAVSTASTEKGPWETRIATWETETGAQMHELRPFERKGREPSTGLLWSPDGNYVLAGVFPGSDSSNVISIFNAKTGRFRGVFHDTVRLNGIVLLPDSSQLVAGCVDGNIYFWDFAKAMEKVRGFEASLPDFPGRHNHPEQDRKAEAGQVPDQQR